MSATPINPSCYNNGRTGAIIALLSLDPLFTGIYVVCGVFFSAVGLYEPLMKIGHSGVSVPLTGFGHLLAEGVRQGISEKGFVGILTGGLTSASGGIAAAIVFSLLASLIFKPKMK